MKNILNNLAIKHVNSNFKLTYNQKQPFLLVTFSHKHTYMYILLLHKKKKTHSRPKEEAKTVRGIKVPKILKI